MDTAPEAVQTPELISFDLWLTLIKSDGRAFKDIRNAVFGAVLAPELSHEEFDGLMRAEDKHADRLAEARGLDVMFGERISMVTDALGKERPSQDLLEDLYQQQTQLLAEYPPVLMDPETAEILADLKKRSGLAVISNTGNIHGAEMRGVLRHLGIHDAFDHFIFSNEIGYAKPDQRIFNALLVRAGVEASSVTHTGDNLAADICGAQQAGMRAVHLASGMILSDIVPKLERVRS